MENRKTLKIEVDDKTGCANISGIDQGATVRKALGYVLASVEELQDCQHCGSPIIASWLEPVITRLRIAEHLLAAVVEEGGVL